LTHAANNNAAYGEELAPVPPYPSALFDNADPPLKTDSLEDAVIQAFDYELKRVSPVFQADHSGARDSSVKKFMFS